MAARFWVSGGTGNWSSTTNWSASSGGASGASVPGSADTAAFNASSGAGTATVDSSVTIQILTMTGFTGTLAFGTNTITLNSSGTVYTGATTFTVTGTPLIIVNNPTATATTVNPTATTEANSISFNIISGSYALNLSSGAAIRDLDTTGFSGSLASAGGTYGLTVYGSMSLSNTTTFSGTPSGTNGYAFSATSGIKTITTNGVTIPSYTNFVGVGGTWKLIGNATFTSTTAINLINGTLDLNNNTMTCAKFQSSNANTRSILFGATGNITCNTAVGGAIFDMTTATNFTSTGSQIVNISCAISVSSSVISGVVPEASALSFNVTAGTYILTFLNTAGHAAKNIDFTGFAGTWSSVACVIYGSLNISTGMTITATTGVHTFASTSATTRTITSNGKTIDFPFTFDGVGGKFQLADALTIGSTKAFTLTNGIFDGNNKTISGLNVNAFSMVTGSVSMLNVTTAGNFTLTSGTLTQTGPNTTGPFTFTAGTLALNNNALTCTTFTSTGATLRTLDYATSGSITVNGASGTLFSATPSATALVPTGTQTNNISSAATGATAITVAASNPAEAYAMSFNITSGSYTLTMLSLNRTYKDVNFTGFSGTLVALASNPVIYGNLTLSPTMTFAAGGGPLTFGGTATGKTITSNSIIYTFGLLFNGVGASWKLQDAMTSSVANLTHTNGTLDLNGKTLTVANLASGYTTGVGTKNLTFNGGTLVCPFGSSNAFNNGNPTGYTTTAGTGTGVISMTGTTAKTFEGAGSTFNCIVSNDGAGLLQINGANTITGVRNTTASTTIQLSANNTINTLSNLSGATRIVPCTFQMSAGTTQTITNWDVIGTSVNNVTINSASAAAHNLVKAGGGIVSADYLTISNSSATPSTLTWYAGTHSTSVSGNSGWIFTAPPAASNGNFFLMF